MLLARGLAARGHTVRVTSLNAAADPGLVRELSAAGVEFRAVGKAALALGLGLGPLLRDLRRDPGAVVLTLLPWADTLGRLAARRLGHTRLVSSIRARNIDKPAWQRALDRRTMPVARTVIFNSAEVVAWSQANEGVQPGQVVVIPNGVEDLSDPDGSVRAEMREAHGLDDADFVIGSVGRLYPQKDHATLLRAFARLVTIHGGDLKLFIVGDGPLRGSLQRLARELNIHDLIFWAGHKDDLRRWYAAFDALAHTAAFEGMPNVVLEAMSAGVPVVASDIDGCRELVTPETGWLAPVGQPNAFATALSEIRREPAAARARALRAQARMRGEFSVDRMVEAYVAVFARLV